MAETVHLYLKANGSDVQGESTQHSLGRENSIECLSFRDAVRTARETGSGHATGRRAYEPITITKRIDKSSPLLAKALTMNQVVEAEFKFFRPHVEDGTTQQFFTVVIKQGRISHINRVSPDTFDPAAANRPPTEEVGFVFHTIRWVYTDGGIEHEDTWNNQT